MNKKMGIFLILILGVGVLFFYTYINRTRYSYQMSGRIEKIDGNYIVVTGPIKSLDPKETHQESKTIEFQITPQTIFKNTTSIISADNIKSGEIFTPKTEEKQGTASDLTVNMRIIKIQTKENLSINSKAIAEEVNYVTYDFQLPTE